MDALLVKLTRSGGLNMRVSLEAGEPGHPRDVVDTVKANVRDTSGSTKIRSAPRWHNGRGFPRSYGALPLAWGSSPALSRSR